MDFLGGYPRTGQELVNVFGLTFGELRQRTRAEKIVDDRWDLGPSTIFFGENSGRQVGRGSAMSRIQ